MGYTEIELEKDNPYNMYLEENEDSRIIERITIGDQKIPLVIYHSNCVDGFSAAWVFHYISGITNRRFEYHKGVYGEALPDVDNRVVYVVDFSYKRDKMFELRDRCANLIWIDHHISAAKELLTGDEDDIQFNSSKIDVLFSLEKSGATLTWEYWKNALGDSFPEERPLLLGHIEDRDLWKFKLPRTEEISANLFSYEYTFENWDKLMFLDEAKLLSFSVAGAAISRKHHKDIAELLKVCKRFTEIGGIYVPVASIPYTMTSDAGHKMAKEFADGGYFAACYWDTEEARKFSLRSCENGMNVSIIAQKYGGGGHKHAAGFSVSRSHCLAVF